MSLIFIDTAYLVALVNPRDQLRGRALEVRQQIVSERLLVTESVLVETLNYFAEFRRDVKSSAYLVVEKFLLNPEVEVVEQTTSVFHDGMEFYRTRLDQGYSLTDCISMKICRMHKINRILTNDDHFKTEGFEILL
jgi:predicted nucleic acid-binding protein